MVSLAKSLRTEPQHYRLTTEYTMLSLEGEEAGTHVVTGEFTMTPQEIQWTQVTAGPAAGHGKPVTSVEHRAFAEGMRYSRADSTKLFTLEFFRNYPSTATEEKNLIWDELMFDSFVRENLDRLRLNEPVVAKSGDVPLAGTGTFTNRGIELTWIGTGRRHDEDCLLVHYEALLNRFTVNAPPIVVSGRSDYLGDIWVSKRTRQIEYGTLLEEVAGTLSNLPGASGPQPLHVLRIASLEHLPH
jgi:hypothetical protein